MRQSNPFEKDEDYIEIKNELQPLLDEILYSTGKAEPKYRKYKKEISKWRDTYNKAMLIGDEIAQLNIYKINEPQLPQLNNVITMFMYLAMVESIGVAFIDFIMLLLITCKSDFHVERFHEFPRLIHAETLEDLQANVSLSSKINFLERNGLTRTSKLVNTKLRNKIAHLKLSKNDFDKRGIVGNNFIIYIRDNFKEFNKIRILIMTILNENKFWERLKLS